MNRILSKKNLPKELIRLEISTPLAQKALQAGHYIVLKTSVDTPAVALPVIKCDPDRGSVSVIYNPLVQQWGEMIMLSVGSVLQRVEGPYGIPLSLPASATVLCVGDDKGAAALLSMITALRKSGNRVVALLKAAGQGPMLLEEEISALAHERILLTRDDSGEAKKNLEQAVARALRDYPIEGVLVAGSARTIRDTFTISIHHPVSTQALLVDAPAGKSVHGIFRVSSNRAVRSVCVDGHDFNAYYPTFDEMVRRFEQSATTPTIAQTASVKA